MLMCLFWNAHNLKIKNVEYLVQVCQPVTFFIFRRIYDIILVYECIKLFGFKF